MDAGMPVSPEDQEEASHLRDVQSPLVISDVTLSYIAGIIDGEGCVTISRRKNDYSTNHGYCYRSLVCVVNTSKELLDYLCGVSGLGSVVKGSKKKNPAHKPSWMWNCWSNESLILLMLVEKFLLVKKKQALLLVEFQKSKKITGKKGLSADEWDVQKSFYLQLKNLNKRGIA